MFAIVNAIHRKICGLFFVRKPHQIQVMFAKHQIGQHQIILNALKTIPMNEIIDANQAIRSLYVNFDLRNQ